MMSQGRQTGVLPAAKSADHLMEAIREALQHAFRDFGPNLARLDPSDFDCVVARLTEAVVTVHYDLRVTNARLRVERDETRKAAIEAERTLLRISNAVREYESK